MVEGVVQVLLLITAALTSIQYFVPQDDPRPAYSRRLTQLAEEAAKRGDSAASRAYMAESLAVWSEFEWDRGNEKLAEQYFFQAREMGWTGPPPWGTAERLQLRPEIQEPEAPVRTPRPEDRRRPATAAKPAADTWSLFSHDPLAAAAGGPWHSLLGIPPAEAASLLPPGLWNARMRLEMNNTDFEESGAGGTSQWDASLVRECFQIDYGLAEWIQAGVRISSGELLERSGSPIRLFQGGAQIVPSGTRGFALSDITLRGKMAADLEGFGLGVLAEMKLPIADEEDLLTSGTTDLAVIGLMSSRADAWGFHVNLGLVAPVGSSDLFSPDEDPSPFVTWSVGASFQVADPLVLIAQFDGHTNGWKDLDDVDEGGMTMSAGARARLSERVRLAGQLRLGLTETSPDMGLTAGLEVDW